LARADTNSRGILIELKELKQPCEIIADGVQIQQVMLNLIRNAIDATEATGIENTRIVIMTKVTPEKDYVEISVRDFGNGVSEDIRDRLFEPFVTLKKSGTGMGLSISRSIVDAHGGDIWAEHLDPGTRFCFILPIAVGEK
ncbi:MAG: sensor histidine kinase, partial [bacterium]